MSDQNQNPIPVEESAALEDPMQGQYVQGDPMSADEPVVHTAPTAQADPMAVDGEEGDAPVEVAPFNVPGVKKQYVQGDPSPAEPAFEIVQASISNPLSMPSLHFSQGADVDSAINENTVVGQEWAQTVTDTTEVDTQGEGEAILFEEGRDWRRAVVHETNRVGSRDMRISSKNKQPTGAMALVAWAASSATKAAGAQITFWGSGISAKFMALNNEQLYDLHHTVVADRIRAGRMTFGLALSAHMVYTMSATLHAARQAINEVSIKNTMDLGDALRVTDFQTLVWGLAHATYSDGFEINRACMASIPTCNHIVTQKVMPRRMWLVDRSSITDEQVMWHHNLTSGSVDQEALDKYQGMFAKTRTRVVNVERSNGSTVEFTFRVPTLNETIQSGQRWIDEINAATVNIIGEKASFKERNTMMEDRMKAAAARQYSHWVEAIRLPGYEQAITDRGDIELLLGNAVSEDDTDLANFLKAVREFHAAMTTTQVVLANYKCPACHKYQMSAEGTDAADDQPPMYIPIEAFNTFFALTYRRLQKVAER